MSQSLLRKVLFLDAVASGGAGVMLAAGAGPLQGLLGLPTDLMRPAGLFLVAYAAVVAAIGRAPEPSQKAVLAVIAVNLLWTAESVLLLTGGQVAPTALGAAFVIFQAVVVGGLALAQIVALRMARVARA